MQRMFSDKRAVVCFLLPGIILFTVVLFIPICYCAYISLCEWNVLTPPKFVGLANYVKLFTRDEIFVTAVKNTFFFMLFFRRFPAGRGYALCFGADQYWPWTQLF